MKTLIFIETILLLVMTSCGSDNASTDGFITVDVTKSSYSPKKELVLQDFMDVEYIPLETNDEFINQGFVQDVGEKYILVKNRKNDEEILINSHHIQKILVYDLCGNYKRTLNHQIGKDSLESHPYCMDSSSFYLEISNYDDSNLICYDFIGAKTPFVIIF